MCTDVATEASNLHMISGHEGVIEPVYGSAPTLTFQ
jgi:hypothetical protein